MAECLMDTETEIPDVRSSPGPSSSEVDVPNLMREEITDISLSMQLWA